MQGFVEKRICGNAYRVLGLHAGASQQQIDQAAREMRIWANPSERPATVWDMPWLGKINRSRSDVEQAVARLAQPVSRINERLYWFAETEPDLSKLKAGLEADVARSLEGSADPVVRHNAMLLEAAAHAAQLIAESKQLVFWEHLLRRAAGISQDDGYRKWLEQVESDGRFEKRASVDETAAALGALPVGMAEDLANAAIGSLDKGDAVLAIKITGLLRKLEANGTWLGDACAPVLDRMEDQYTAACNSIWQSASKDIHTRWDRAGAEKRHNEQVCRELAQRYQTMVAPACRGLSVLFADAGDQGRAERIRLLSAKALKSLASASYWSQDFVAAEWYYTQAIPLAAGTGMERTLLADRERIRLTAERQRKGWRVDVPAKGIAAGESFYQRGRRTSRGGIGLIFIAIMVVSIISGVISGNRTGINSPESINDPQIQDIQRTLHDPDIQAALKALNNQQTPDGNSPRPGLAIQRLMGEGGNGTGGTVPTPHQENQPWLPGSSAPGSPGGNAPSAGKH